MIHQLQKPQHLISLASSGVLVSVDVSVWGATKQDRGISDEITNAKKANKAAGKYVKNLLADHPTHKAVTNYRQTIYNWVARSTYPWNRTQEYLPSVSIEKFKQEYNAHRDMFKDTLVANFLKEYDSIVSDMAFAQGEMFNRDDYPDKELIASKFSMELYVSEVPMSDFRCAISQALADDLFATYKAQTETIIHDIVGEQKKRFIAVMESLSHCCGVEETGVAANGETKTRKRKIYDSTVQKALDMCDSFQQFNLTQDSALEDARAALQMTLRGVDAEMIRESDAVRASVKEGVDDILSKFGKFNCV